jgi:uncharacterized peroxidase-related enzyme
MSLVQPLPNDHDPEVSELAQFFQTTLGFPPNSVLTMQRRPAIAKAFIQLNRAVMENRGRLSSEQKRLVGLLASTVAGCRYCQAHTALAAQRFGSTPERLEAIWTYADSPLFSDAEKVAFDFAIAAARQPGAVDDTIGDRLRQHWDDGEIVELLGVVALFGYLNRWNDGMATTLEPPAREAAMEALTTHGWTAGKHDQQAQARDA